VRIVTIGGGPAGLYGSLLMKKAHPDHDITVIERNPADATYGWGVVFSDRTLSEFREADAKTFQEITDHFVPWDAIDIRFRDQVVRSGGHVFAGLSRKRLLGILQRRCEELGVELRFETEADDLGELRRADLVVAADGVRSFVREALGDAFGPRFQLGGSKYIWYGTPLTLDSFTFSFRENDHGLFQAHAYPFDGTTSTFIVECTEEVWRRAGLDAADEGESIAYCEKLFADDLRGRGLLSNNSQWVNFVTIRNRSWHQGNVVLLGDAAHTAHFSIGSGTKLAMEDAISLARALEQRGADVGAALADYESERKPVVERFQQAADESRTYFEDTARYLHFEPMQFAFHLLTRSGRIDYDVLRLRDPAYADGVDRWFARSEGVVAPPPLFTPFRIRGLSLPSRVVHSPRADDTAKEGTPPAEYQSHLIEAAEGSSLVMTPVVAVSSEGRTTPGDAGIYRPEQAEAWRHAVEAVHGRGTTIGLRLGHAGRRGSTRPRHNGLDRPLRNGGWPLLSASPIPYSSRNTVPKAMDHADMEKVAADFTEAAKRALKAGFDLLQLHMAHGYLLGSFLSPLSNTRTDEYGGSLENRLRYPLEVLDAVRAVWPDDRPLSVALTASDWARGGFDVDDAIVAAEAMKDHGCDLIQVLAGYTTPRMRPRYGAAFLAPYADRVRNEAGIPTLVGGGITTTGRANTVLAAGRADLCILDHWA
jgi:anthraniloyl-CoA monooxygenase